MKHTPGPWQIGRYGKHPRAIWGATNALPIAKIHSDGASTAVNNANARLIAAAPDLLEALKSLDKRLRTYTDLEGFTVADAYDSLYQDLVSSTIYKATGDKA